MLPPCRPYIDTSLNRRQEDNKRPQWMPHEKEGLLRASVGSKPEGREDSESQSGHEKQASQGQERESLA